MKRKWNKMVGTVQSSETPRKMFTKQKSHMGKAQQ